MRLQLAALIATSIIAIVAAVFAIWPVVGEAPWEDDTPPVAVEDNTQLCEGALRLRETAVQALAEASGARLSIRQEIEGQLRQAEREIDRYC